MQARKMSPELEAELLAWWNPNRTYEEAFKKFALDRHVMKRFIKRNGLVKKMGPRRYTDDEMKRIKAMVAQGKTAKEIALAVGRTENAVAKVICDKYPRRKVKQEYVCSYLSTLKLRVNL